MLDIVFILQAICGMSWAIYLGLLLPSFIRCCLNKGTRLDSFQVPLFFLALDQTWMVARWRIWPGAMSNMGYYELQGWAVAYVGGIVAAAGLVATTFYANRKS